MILTADTLRRIFQTLYGYRWAEEAAEHMGCGLRTIRRWTSSGGRAPVGARTQIVLVIDAKISDLENLREDITQR